MEVLLLLKGQQLQPASLTMRMWDGTGGIIPYSRSRPDHQSQTSSLRAAFGEEKFMLK